MEARYYFPNFAILLGGDSNTSPNIHATDVWLTLGILIGPPPMGHRFGGPRLDIVCYWLYDTCGSYLGSP